MNAVVHEAINRQINAELTASYSYLQMSAFCARQAFNGCAHWLRLQADEEREHAMKLFDFVQDRDGRAVLQAIPQPPREFGSPINLFEQVLAHEQEVTSLIEQLYRKAVAEQDHATQIFLQWFITEQVEEEKTASQLLETLKLAGDNKVALLMLDRELGARSAPTA